MASPRGTSAMDSDPGTSGGAFFDRALLALPGFTSFPWQWDLYRRIAAGRPPGSCRVPTGLGKTAVIPA